MDAMAFSAYWHTHFPHSSPIGHLLRVDYKERWFRIHTLPELKRYPDTEAEYQEILHRHSTMLDELFPQAHELLFVATSYSETLEPAPIELDHIPFSSFRHVSTIPLHEIEGDTWPNFGNIWLSTLPWPYSPLTALLRDVAQRHSADWLLLDPSQHRIYHPYDGGADIILETVEKKLQLKQKHTLWLSPHPLGL